MMNKLRYYVGNNLKLAAFFIYVEYQMIVDRLLGLGYNRRATEEVNAMNTAMPIGVDD